MNFLINYSIKNQEYYLTICRSKPNIVHNTANLTKILNSN